jgi:hypothetical protein
MSMEDPSQGIGLWIYCHRRFQQLVRIGVFQKLWIRLLKIYDDIRGIDCRWQSLDSSASIKAPLGGTRQVTVIPRIEEVR